MYDVINNLYHLNVSLQMETGNVPDRLNNISVSIGLQIVIDRYGTDQKAIRYNRNIVLVATFSVYVSLSFYVCFFCSIYDNSTTSCSEIFPKVSIIRYNFSPL